MITKDWRKDLVIVLGPLKNEDTSLNRAKLQGSKLLTTILKLAPEKRTSLNKDTILALVPVISFIRKFHV